MRAWSPSGLPPPAAAAAAAPRSKFGRARPSWQGENEGGAGTLLPRKKLDGEEEGCAESCSRLMSLLEVPGRSERVLPPAAVAAADPPPPAPPTEEDRSGFHMRASSVSPRSSVLWGKTTRCTRQKNRQQSFTKTGGKTGDFELDMYHVGCIMHGAGEGLGNMSCEHESLNHLDKQIYTPT